MVFVVVAGIVVVLLAAAAVYDLVARRRGRYRPAAHWQAVSRRRKAHFRRARNEQRGGGDPAGPNDRRWG